jgi:hypothetical protein
MKLKQEILNRYRDKLSDAFEMKDITEIESIIQEIFDDGYEEGYRDEDYLLEHAQEVARDRFENMRDAYD